MDMYGVLLKQYFDKFITICKSNLWVSEIFHTMRNTKIEIQVWELIDVPVVNNLQRYAYNKNEFLD